MKKLSLVCTYHSEYGLVTVDRLVAILQSLQPEVIFMEAPYVPPGDEFEVEAIKNRESFAVMEYRRTHSVNLHPVDLPTPDETFFRRFYEITNEVRRKSHDYYQLFEEYKRSLVLEGFDYLNSDRMSHNERLRHGAMMEWLERLNNVGYSQFYERFNETNVLRDRAMVDRIEKYSLASDYTNAVFLVGASHRESIIKYAVALTNAERSHEWFSLDQQLIVGSPL